MITIDEKQNQKNIKRFIRRACEFDAIRLLKSVYLYNLYIISEQANGLKHKNYDIMRFLIIYLINIFQSVKVPNNISRSHNDLIELETLIDDFEKMFLANETIISSLDDNIDMFRLKDTQGGISYPFITLDIYYYLLLDQANLIELTYGISLVDLFTTLSETSLLLRSVPDTLDLSKGFINNLSDIDNVLPDNHFDLMTISKIPKKMLIDLSHEIGGGTDFISRTVKPGWPFVDMPTEFTPLIKQSDIIFCFDHNLLFDTLYRNMQRYITSKEKINIELWNKNQKTSSENLVFVLFQNLFAEDNILRNNYYKLGSKWHENDLLIIENDLLLIVEIKAGSYTHRSALTDIESHKSSIINLIDKPTGQVDNLLNALDESNILVIYDSEGRNAKSKFTIDANKINVIVGITVTIDHFNEITAQYFNYGDKKTINSTPISIYDLFIVLNYFRSRIQFIHYLLFRNEKFVKNMIVYDELSFLEMYIENQYFHKNLQMTEQEFEGANFFISPNIENIDKYFYYYPNLQKKDRPKKKVYSEIKTIVRMMEKQSAGDIYKAGTTLLSIDYEFQKSFITKAKQIEKESKKHNKFGFVKDQDKQNLLALVYVHKSRLEKFDIDLILNDPNIKSLKRNKVIIGIVYDDKKKKYNIMDILIKVVCEI